LWCRTKAVEIAAGGQVKISVNGAVDPDSFVASDATYSQSATILVTGVQSDG
jgi:hypothetical protein